MIKWSLQWYALNFEDSKMFGNWNGNFKGLKLINEKQSWRYYNQ